MPSSKKSKGATKRRDPTAKQLEELRGRHATLLKDSEDLERQLEEAQDSIERLESSRRILSEKLAKSQTSLGADEPSEAPVPATVNYTLMNQQLRDENEKLVNLNNDLSDELISAEDERQSLAEELAAAVSQIEETRTQWETTCEKLEAKIATQAAALEEVTEALRAAQLAHESAVDEHAALKSSHDSLRGGIQKKIKQMFPDKALPDDFDLTHFAELIDSFAEDAKELGTLRALKDSFEARERKLSALEDHAKSKLETIQERLDSVNRTRSTLIAVINEFVSAIDPKNAKRLHLAETFTYGDLKAVMSWLGEARTRLGKFKSAFGMAQKI